MTSAELIPVQYHGGDRDNPGLWGHIVYHMDKVDDCIQTGVCLRCEIEVTSGLKVCLLQ